MTQTIAHPANADIASALAEARADFVKRNPKSQKVHEDACASLPSGNTRTVLFYGPFPATMVKGEGANLWDADGNKYVDFLGEYTAGIYGHSHPVIRRAIDQALDDGINRGAHNQLEGKVASLICARFHSVELMRFTNSGTEASLMAITLARGFTQRKKVMVFEGGYHGGIFTFHDGNNPANGPFDFVIAPYNDMAGTKKMIAEIVPAIWLLLSRSLPISAPKTLVSYWDETAFSPGLQEHAPTDPQRRRICSATFPVPRSYRFCLRVPPWQSRARKL